MVREREENRKGRGREEGRMKGKGMEKMGRQNLAFS